MDDTMRDTMNDTKFFVNEGFATMKKRSRHIEKIISENIFAYLVCISQIVSLLKC
jgi:hypothetical protein